MMVFSVIREYHINLDESIDTHTSCSWLADMLVKTEMIFSRGHVLYKTIRCKDNLNCTLETL